MRQTYLELVLGDIDKQIQLDLIAVYKTGNITKAIFFRPESIKNELDKKGLLTWGKIDAKYRNSIVLLKEKFENLQAFVFSGNDSILYDFQWSNAYYEKQKVAVSQKFQELSSDNFVTEFKEFTCNNYCEHRLNCPHWLGLYIVG